MIFFDKLSYYFIIAVLSNAFSEAQLPSTSPQWVIRRWNLSLADSAASQESCADPLPRSTMERSGFHCSVRRKSPVILLPVYLREDCPRFGVLGKLGEGRNQIRNRCVPILSGTGSFPHGE